MFNQTKVGDTISLQKRDVKVERCKYCNRLMVNLDAKDVEPGDLVTLKRKGVVISNPDTKDLVCVICEVDQEPSFREKLSDFFSSVPVIVDDDWHSDDNDDDSGFFGGGGGFGGFGGGSFSGGGASRGF